MRKVQLPVWTKVVLPRASSLSLLKCVDLCWKQANQGSKCHVSTVRCSEVLPPERSPFPKLTAKHFESLKIPPPTLFFPGVKEECCQAKLCCGALQHPPQGARCRARDWQPGVFNAAVQFSAVCFQSSHEVRRAASGSSADAVWQRSQGRCCHHTHLIFNDAVRHTHTHARTQQGAHHVLSTLSSRLLAPLSNNVLNVF